MNKKQNVAILISFLLAIAAIAISLLRCEPFEIDALAVLANILSLMVTILLGIIAYNYFIQKNEINKYKQELKDEVSKEILDVYINIMGSFGASKESASLFTMGVTVLKRIEDNNNKDISIICSLLLTCYNSITPNDKANPVIKSSINHLQEKLNRVTHNPVATQLLNAISENNK